VGGPKSFEKKITNNTTKKAYNEQLKIQKKQTQSISNGGGLERRGATIT